MGKGGKSAGGDLLADVAHEVEEEMDVVGGEEDVAEDFIGFDEMAEVGTGEILASVAGAVRGDGFGVAGELGIAEVEAAAVDEGAIVASEAGGEDTVEDVDTAPDGVDKVFGGADAHQIAWFVGGEDGIEPFDDLVHLGLRFTNGQATDSVARQIEIDQKLGALFAQVAEDTTLDDTEKGLVGAGFGGEATLGPRMGAC